jgi:serine/threonine protein kinase
MCEIFPQVSASFETKYELKEKIGQGGMGSVFSAVERSTKRILAIKFFKRILFGDVSAQQHFVQEAKLLATLSSSQSNANLVSVYGFGTEGDNLYIAFEYVDGVTLRDEIDGGRISTIKRACEIVGSMCRGLALLHQKQIVHMDLKPENVMITKSGQVKIIDLGISLSLNQRKKTSDSEGVILGTPLYMSPEQCGEEKITYRSDLYSLGVIFYELIAGIPPFIGSTDQIIRAHLSKTPRSFSSINIVLSPSLESLILLLLEKDPAIRPKSALYLAGELKKLLKTPEFSESLLENPIGAAGHADAVRHVKCGNQYSETNLTAPLAPTVRIASRCRPKQPELEGSLEEGVSVPASSVLKEELVAHVHMVSRRSGKKKRYRVIVAMVFVFVIILVLQYLGYLY